uniref:Uncharacterized protein n=1 Tax=Meloidogyne enterolobii TaxID=390850 RepID=A0A6V7W4B8_MELEN|nr:unnamed protein product [Meloidogyne enterolobii]
MSDKNSEKKELLLLIKENYSTIAGKFSSKITFDEKRQVWEQIFNTCKSKNASWTKGRDSKWLSGTKWPSLVKEFKAKLDRNRATGSGGENRLNELDQIISDILGVNSPSIVGLNVPDAGSSSTAEWAYYNPPSISESVNIFDETLQETTPKTKRKRDCLEIMEEDAYKKKKEEYLDLLIDVAKLKKQKLLYICSSKVVNN